MWKFHFGFFLEIRKWKKGVIVNPNSLEGEDPSSFESVLFHLNPSFPLWIPNTIIEFLRIVFTEPDLSNNKVQFFYQNFDIRELEELIMKNLTQVLRDLFYLFVAGKSKLAHRQTWVPIWKKGLCQYMKKPMVPRESQNWSCSVLILLSTFLVSGGV